MTIPMDDQVCTYCNGIIPRGWPVRWWIELINGEEVMATAHRFKSDCVSVKEDEAKFIKELGISI